MNRHNDGPPILGMVGNALPLVGVLKDFVPHPPEERLSTDYAVARYERKVQASAGRWVSLVVTGGIVALFAFGLHGGLAPLLVLVWLFLMNRLVWQEHGNPSPKAAVKYTRLGFLMLAASVAATLFALLFALLPSPFFSGAATVSALVALVLALVDPFLTARSVIEAQVPPAPDLAPFATIQAIFGISDLAVAKYVESGSLEATVNPVTGMLTARIPVGPDTLLEDRKALDARVALKAPTWQVAFADPSTDELILEPVDEATVARRAAMSRSDNLFAEALGTGLDDLEVIDLGVTEPPLPRLS